MEKQVLIVVGHKDGEVYFQSGGTDGVPPRYVAWSPDGAREVAALILAAADEAEGALRSSADPLT